MPSFNQNDTIAAIATPIGDGGIGIVRLSGKRALSIANKIFVSPNGKKPSTFASHSINYGWITSRFYTRSAGKPPEVIDEVILTVMRAPRSYTREDVVEINCHAGIVVLRAVLELVLANGARLAEPGEFTRRAFLNGRIDLSQAEAVLDVIRAKTDSALKVGIDQLKGGLSSRINRLRDKLLSMLSIFEANIDFPDEEITPADLENCRRKISGIGAELKNILESSRFGKIMREGIKAVICGKPNVGKSSLLNALLKQERSIVSSMAGTTRDTIEEIIDIRGVPVRIVDTAGIIEPRDLVEKKAVRRAKKHISDADLVILMFDASKRLDKYDNSLIKKIGTKTTVAVINKIDLKSRIQKDRVYKKFSGVVEISAKRLKNIDLLEEAILNLVYHGKVSVRDSAIASNARHIQALKKASEFILAADKSLGQNLTLEVIAQDIKDALACFDDIMGRRFSSDLLDKIFSQFCIGK
ncbi:MAG: tRNA uridine-5-carboxymethylaminomethyl(34) synthesis GTPase MnmE [Candidatus Omnitrophota bacterium]|nr:tRNA uridine-5-carboxymethylaminomethyl(34) synthesis GTPase MnmE [Candidatus Omnitrophota bacterium]MBU1928313.1 tRNA uridine-5-carboxymethylaminomethyl(34) synthesis GTPase MnmE [Candidatus Omnitrophota bacterium]MBU2035531.1 tRNA uridine-5-carboxymethylaminomethyl(34) synthesis GTPase MnmE [Candidatus Omnitrophota bacterium]MBU2222052.1 tRNA uridine-5-carboxymethylaminomethyl(34) synthesis GTPase MnmE [Candidatus Omnitrophota bacterium]MBU2258374.1 tRNA uridine-5-carboxymethylaminomethyl(